MRDPQEKPDYTDLLLIARLHSYVGSPRMEQLTTPRSAAGHTTSSPWVG